jgi:hypothetical protein
VVEFEAVETPMRVGADREAPFRFLAGLRFVESRGLDEASRAAVLQALEATVDAHASPTGVFFGSTAWHRRVVVYGVTRSDMPVGSQGRGISVAGPDVTRPLPQPPTTNSLHRPVGGTAHHGSAATMTDTRATCSLLADLIRV